MADENSDLIGFSDFKIPLLKIPKLKSLRNPFNEPIYYRELESSSEILAFVIHGLGGDSRYLTQLGLSISTLSSCHVVLPDLKFHGEMNQGNSVSLLPHQDIILELDFLLENIKQRKKVSNVVLVGHSLGGSIVLKWLLEKEPNSFSKIALISPYLPEPYNVESVQFSKWIKRDNGNLSLQFPESSKWGSEIEHYDRSFIRACVPETIDFGGCAKLCESIDIFASDADQILDINKYRRFFQNLRGIRLIEQTGLSHIGLVTSRASSQTIADHLLSIGTKSG